MTKKQYVTNDIVKFDYSDIWKKSDDEMYTATPLRNDEVIELLNKQEEIIQDLKCRINSIYAILREEKCGDGE